MTTDIATNMNLNMMKYLPKPQMDINILKTFQKRMENWMKEKDREQAENNKMLSWGREFEFIVNRLKSEVDYFNKTFTPEKMEQFNMISKELEQFSMDLLVLDGKI